MDQVSWNEVDRKRSIQIYTSEGDAPGVFGVAAADEVGGTTTSCGAGEVICTGSTNFGYNLYPRFAVNCGSRSYFGRGESYDTAFSWPSFKEKGYEPEKVAQRVMSQSVAR